MKRVLIVEDVAEMRALLLEVFRDGSGSASAVASTLEARLEIDRRRPDCVFLDEVLPGESSLDLLAELESRQIPVILLTGMASVNHPLPSGARERWIKPTWNTLAADRARFLAVLDTL